MTYMKKVTVLLLALALLIPNNRYDGDGICCTQQGCVVSGPAGVSG